MRREIAGCVASKITGCFEQKSNLDFCSLLLARMVFDLWRKSDKGRIRLEVARIFLFWRSFSSFEKESCCDFLMKDFIVDLMSYAFRLIIWCRLSSVVEGGEIAEGEN